MAPARTEHAEPELATSTRGAELTACGEHAHSSLCDPCEPLVASGGKASESGGERGDVGAARRTRAVLVARLGALVLLTAGLVALSRNSALRERLALKSRRAQLDAFGSTAPALAFGAYVVMFCGGELLHVPGVVFIVLGVLLFGRWGGFGAAFFGSVASVCFSFVVVRAIGGQPISAAPRWKRAAALVDAVAERPIAAVALLRLLLWVAPPVNYFLAMSAVSFRDYALGSALGLWPPVLAICLATDALLPWLESSGLA